MKYRIVKTENGKFRIQISFLGIFWRFCVEPTVFYSNLDNGYVRERWLLSRTFQYDTKEDAEKSVEKLKEGCLFYRKHSIDLLSICDDGPYEYRYFVTKGIFSNVYKKYFDTLEQAKEYVDLYWSRKEDEEKKNKVKEVLSYY